MLSLLLLLADVSDTLGGGTAMGQMAHLLLLTPFERRDANDARDVAWPVRFVVTDGATERYVTAR